jgi:hypothetical protein
MISIIHVYNHLETNECSEPSIATNFFEILVFTKLEHALLLVAIVAFGSHTHLMLYYTHKSIISNVSSEYVIP